MVTRIPAQPVRLLRTADVELRTGLKRSQLNYKESEGSFPKRVQISTRACGWVESEVDAWVQARIIESRGGAVCAAPTNANVARRRKAEERRQRQPPTPKSRRTSTHEARAAR
jgi:prophage regulatory protein